ncbi:MAG: type IV pilus assembly protein PilM [Candidatus Eisenbacteria bacterium]|nr:type IV pilus assembly protein PilM [Candidatus Eisenbacteria bacterium]
MVRAPCRARPGGGEALFGKPKRTVALDIGASSIKLVEVERRGSKSKLAHCAVAALDSDAIVDGEVMNRPAVVRTIGELFSGQRIQRRRVVSGICGRGVIVKKIAMERMNHEEASEAIYWEAEQHVPYGIDDVVLDFKILDTDIGPSQMQVLLVAAKRNVVMNHAEIVRESGLIPDVVDVHSFAVQNVLELNHAPEPGQVVALLNAGAEITNICIVRDGTPLYTQDISTGAHRLIHAVQRAHQIPRREADEAIRGASNGKIDISPLLDEFCRELSAGLDKSLIFLRTAGDADGIDRVVVSGGCARIPGFLERLRAAQSVPVEQIDPLAEMEIPSGTLDAQEAPAIAPQLAVAIGLALRKGRGE